MKKEEWKEQIKWGLTAFSVLALVTLVYVLASRFYFVTNFLGFFVQILTPIIYGAVLAYLMSPVYNTVVNWCSRVSLSIFKRKAHRRILAVSGTVASLLFLSLLVSGLVSMLIPELSKSVMSLYNFRIPSIAPITM